MTNCLRILIFILVISLVACSSGNKAKNDSDTVPDSDYNTQDSETTDDDSDIQDSEIVDDTVTDVDDTETDDSDSDTDEPLDVDYQGAEDCPELSKAKFPYYNDNKTIHFCRKCDTPTVKDPQCMANLWKEAAAKLYAVSPESECKDGYPCEMTGIRNRTLEDWIESEEKTGHTFPYRPHECDIILSAQSISTNDRWATDGTAGSFKHFNISDGKIGIKLENVSTKLGNYTTTSKVMIYDPAEKKYKAVAPMFADMLAYHKGCFLYMGVDFRSSDYFDNRYLFYVCEDGSRKVVYPGKINFLSYTPALSEKWAIANIAETEDGGSVTMYAKVGEWRWTKLMEGLSYEPQIVNDNAVFYDDYFKAYYCDLSKNPQSVADCIVVNETENEEIRTPVINEDDETEIIYESDISENMSMKRLKIGANGKKEYSLVTDKHESADDVWEGGGFGISNVTKDFVFYNEFLYGNGKRDGNACFYNRKTKKTTCMKRVEGMETYYFGFDEWEGKWLLYQFRGVALQAVRDLDCYCEKEGVCPFEE
ncbi:hypothetical protein IKO70_00775 [bacterium]|nr:hypothetical protein [bacterium]